MGNIRLEEYEICRYLGTIEKYLKKNSISFYEVSPSFNSRDSVSVNKEARRMLDFVGLTNYIAVISYSRTGKNEGGNIELDNNKEVFIEISSEMLGDHNRVLAVMAHEICHKVLYVNGLYYRAPIPQIENEKLTDLATIYVGFSKLTLNGCYNQYKTEFGSKTTIHTVETGYLSLESFAMAFNMVCIRFGVTPSKHDLSPFASYAVSNHTFNNGNMPSIVELKDNLKYRQEYDAEEMSALVILEDIISQIKNKIINKHKNYYDSFIKPVDYVNDKIVDNFKVMEAYSRGVNTSNYESLQRIDSLKHIIGLLEKFSVVDFKKLLDIECPHCGYKKSNALKENATIFLKCPKCGYFFLWNGNQLNLPEEETTNTDESFFKKISSFFHKLKF